MVIKILTKSALRSLQHHKVRSLLTMLGIIIGITSIIATLSIGYGTEEKIKQQIAAVGNNYIEIWAKGIYQTDGVIKSTRQRVPKKLVLSDINAIRLQCSHITYVSPFIYDHGITEYKGTPIISDIKGGNANLLRIMGRKIMKGQHFTNHHIKNNSRVAILGFTAAKELFNKENPLGKSVFIKNTQFIVIGILQKIDNYMGMRDPNLDIFVPYSTAKKHIRYTVNKYIHGIIMSADSLETMPAAVNQVKKVMRARHNIPFNEADDFSLTDQQSMFKAAKETSRTFNLFLLIIASISLLVGGIGVMNIMLVSVTERTVEIGIRMALGAKTRIILLQFLIESVTLCLFGGFIGIIGGLVSPFIIQYFSKIPVIIRAEPIMLSCFTIILIGVIFGFYPAYKASQLNPVEALTKT